jgi:hypothetical protein
MKKSFIIVLICVVSAIALFLLIWAWFLTDGIIPIGSNLTKADWLGFLSGFLGFVGTTFLGAITLLQTNQINKQNLLSEHKVHLGTCINGSVSLGYMCFDDDFSKLKNIILLDDKNARNGAVLYIVIPFNVCSDSSPDSFSVNYVVVHMGYKSVKFTNILEKHYPVNITEIDRIEINFQLCSHDKEFLEQAQRYEHTYYEIQANFKIGNVITPVLCQIFIGDNEENKRVVLGGSIQPYKPYIEK